MFLYGIKEESYNKLAAAAESLMFSHEPLHYIVPYKNRRQQQKRSILAILIFNECANCFCGIAVFFNVLPLSNQDLHKNEMSGSNSLLVSHTVYLLVPNRVHKFNNCSLSLSQFSFSFLFDFPSALTCRKCFIFIQESQQKEQKGMPIAIAKCVRGNQTTLMVREKYVRCYSTTYILTYLDITYLK